MKRVNRNDLRSPFSENERYNIYLDLYKKISEDIKGRHYLCNMLSATIDKDGYEGIWGFEDGMKIICKYFPEFAPIVPTEKQKRELTSASVWMSGYHTSTEEDNCNRLNVLATCMAFIYHQIPLKK